MENVRPRTRGPQPFGYSEELATVLNTVFGTLSQSQLAFRTRGEISAATFGRLRRGKVPSPFVLSKIAEYFLAEVTRDYAEDITGGEGEPDVEQVTRWLAAKAGLTSATTAEGDAAEKIRQFAGAEDLPPEDINTIGAIVQAFITERRRQRGME